MAEAGTPPNTLFDLEQYTVPGARPRTKPQRKPVEPVETIEVRAGQVWRLVRSKQPGVVHAFMPIAQARHQFPQRNFPGGAVVTYCGKLAVPKTFEPDQVVRGCAACKRAGAESWT